MQVNIALFVLEPKCRSLAPLGNLCYYYYMSLSDSEKARQYAQEAEDTVARLVNDIEEELLAMLVGKSESQQQYILQKLHKRYEKYLLKPFLGNSMGRIAMYIRKDLVEYMMEDPKNLRQKPEFSAMRDSLIITAGGLEAEYIIASFGDSGEPLAVKILRENTDELVKQGFELVRQAFITEQRVLLALAEYYGDEDYPPNLLKLYAVGNGVTATERVMEAQRLEKTAREVDSYGLHKRWSWLQDIADGLTALYRMPLGVIRHGDLSLNNCILGADGTVRICDYSLVTTDVRSRRAVGKWSYIAPEIVLRSKRPDDSPLLKTVDVRADVFSLAIMAYEILSAGKYPMYPDGASYSDTSVKYWSLFALHAAEVCARQDECEFLSCFPISPQFLRHFAKKYQYQPLSLGRCPFVDDSEVLTQLDRCIQKAMSFDPRDRHRTPQLFIQELTEILDQLP